MSLKNLYLLRIIELEVYLEILQLFIFKSVLGSFQRKCYLMKLERDFAEERKDIRQLLNLIELEKLCQTTI